MEESVLVSKIWMDACGMEADTPDDATFFIGIKFNTNITEMEYKMNRKMRRHKTSSKC